MTAHVRAFEGAIELKDDGDTPDAIAKALANITQTVDDRLKAVETKTADRLDKVEAKLNRPAVHTKAQDETDVETKAFASFLRGGRDRLDADEIKALRVSDDTSGGYFATPEFSNEVLKGIVEISPMRQAARIGSTSSGSVVLPKRTGRPSTRWVGEIEERTETGSTYGQVELPIHEAAAFVDVSMKMLEDAAINVPAEVASDLAEEFGRQEGEVFLKGNGAKKPLGILNAEGIAHTATGNASTLGTAPADLLVTHLYSLPAYYRNSGAWMMNGSTLATIRKLKDGDGRFLWQPAYAAGQPETILGRPVIEAPDMDGIGAGTIPIIFGDFARAYRIYDRVTLSLQRDDYSQADFGLVRFRARRRVGGGLVMAEAVKFIKCATA
jgi:HK97 family phage major capsid protein